jgi:hypothetical protein
LLPPHSSRNFEIKENKLLQAVKKLDTQRFRLPSRVTFQFNIPFVFNGLFDASLQLARGIPFAGCYLQNVEVPVQRIRN